MTIHIVLEQHRLLIHKVTREVYQVYEVLPNGNVILECECDGSMQHDDDRVNGDGTPEEVLKKYEVWQPGMVIFDRTGKSSFCGWDSNTTRKSGWSPNRGSGFFGVPSKEIESRVFTDQPPCMPPMFSTKGLDRLKLRGDPK